MILYFICYMAAVFKAPIIKTIFLTVFGWFLFLRYLICSDVTLFCFHDFSPLHLEGFVEEDSPYSPDAQKGTYFFEFSRPLRTRDHLQQVRNNIFTYCCVSLR